MTHLPEEAEIAAAAMQPVDTAIVKIVDEQSGPSKGIKRPRHDLVTEQNNGHTLHVMEDLTPRSASPHSANDTSFPAEIQFYDDNCHEEYEWVRLPKKRGYDLYHVMHAMRGTPEDRDDLDCPLTATKHDGTEVTLWANLDTGADANIINLSTVKELLGSAASQRIRSGSDREYATAGGNQFRPKHSVDLDFVAGVSRNQFRKVRFEIYEDKDLEESGKDGFPDVILGLEFLRENSMVMIDLEYCHGADPALPVLAKRAKEEGNGDVAGPLAPIKYPPRPPVVRGGVRR